MLIGSRQKQVFFDFFKAVHILPVDEAAAFRSVALEESLYLKGKPIGKLDMLIASVCLVHKLPLLTMDKGFTNITDLDVILV